MNSKDSRQQIASQPSYSIGELAELAEVTPRTIRYYTGEGLLPPPETQGKYARYNVDHFNRLRLIARLKSAYLPLGEIRARLEGLNSAGVLALLNEPVPQVAETSSAADYIASVVARQQAGSPTKSEPFGVAPQMMLTESVDAPPAPAPAPAPRVGFFRKLAPQRQNTAPATPPAETWRRIVLAPGVELHLRDSHEPKTQGRIQALIEHARRLFGTDGA